MAVRRTTSYALNEVARFRTSDEILQTEAPNGIITTIPTPRGYADVWLNQPGTWIVNGNKVEVEGSARAIEEPITNSPLSDVRLGHAILASTVIAGQKNETFNVGDTLRISSQYRHPADLLPLDVGDVTLKVWRVKESSPRTYSMTSVGVGVYECDVLIWGDGEFHIEVSCKGRIMRSSFTVETSYFPA